MIKLSTPPQMNVSKALDKVTEWQQAAGQLKQQLPPGDQVLAHWYRLLSDFKQDLPLLKKLSSNALKVKLISHRILGSKRLNSTPLGLS